MSAQIIPFAFHDHNVRTVLVDGEPWFVLSDVAKALSYRDACNAGRCLSDGQKADTQIVSTSSGGTEQARTVTIINESGLYRLVLRSRKPEAVAFSDWVTGEVLPAIRKQGFYMANGAEQLHEAINLASEVAQQVTRTVMESLLTGEGDWEIDRWLFSFSHDMHGKRCAYAKVLDRKAMPVSMERLAEMINAPGGICPPRS